LESFELTAKLDTFARPYNVDCRGVANVASMLLRFPCWQEDRSASLTSLLTSTCSTPNEPYSAAHTSRRIRL